jgi:PAS domain S-box-containing protein
MQEDLRSAKKRLEHVIESNPAIIYIAQPLPDRSDYYATYQSKSTSSITGFEPEAFIGEKGAAFWASRVHPDDLASYRAATGEFWTEGHQACEYRLLHKNGTYRWIREEANIIRDSTGNIRDIIGYWTDITDRKRMEGELLKSNRLAAIGETASMVAHDLRNPLQGITTAIHLLKQESLTAKERNELLRLIQNSVEYSESIVRDLTAYAAEIQLNLIEATPKSTIREALGGVKVPPMVTVHDNSEEYPRLRIDSDKMRRVMTNIIENAIDAMPQGGTLTISSKESDGNVEIDFSDTGSGFPEKIMQNLWKPLQTTKAKGMGLGLAICKRIVDAHGGSISVTSKAGEGTTVKICLPTRTVEVKPK